MVAGWMDGWMDDIDLSLSEENRGLNLDDLALSMQAVPRRDNKKINWT